MNYCLSVYLPLYVLRKKEGKGKQRRNKEINCGGTHAAKMYDFIFLLGELMHFNVAQGV